MSSFISNYTLIQCNCSMVFSCMQLLNRVFVCPSTETNKISKIIKFYKKLRLLAVTNKNLFSNSYKTKARNKCTDFVESLKRQFIERNNIRNGICISSTN